jgi:hypothetical protein
MRGFFLSFAALCLAAGTNDLRAAVFALRHCASQGWHQCLARCSFALRHCAWQAGIKIFNILQAAILLCTIQSAFTGKNV